MRGFCIRDTILELTKDKVVISVSNKLADIVEISSDSSDECAAEADSPI